MAEIIEVSRKSNALRHPLLPCVSSHYTINLTAGCPFECRYCYARSFSSHPGAGKIIFYSNTLKLLERELPRKRKKPDIVFFSTACEPFAPYPNILDMMYSIMKLLLEDSVHIRISTKSVIPENFLKLFARYTGQVHARVGLTTTNDRLRQLLEPKAAGVENRIKSIRDLAEHGVKVGVGMDPIIPGLTDTQESVIPLFKEIEKCGARDAVASYLFLRRAIHENMRLDFGEWSFRKMAKKLFTQKITEYCGGGVIRTASQNYRRNKYALLKTIAADHGVSLRLCGCKNPDITKERCQSKLLTASQESKQLSFLKNLH